MTVSLSSSSQLSLFGPFQQDQQLLAEQAWTLEVDGSLRQLNQQHTRFTRTQQVHRTRGLWCHPHLFSGDSKVLIVLRV